MEAKNCAVEKNIIIARQLIVKPAAQFQHRRDAAGGDGGALGGLVDAGYHLEQRGLACAVAADDAEDLAALDVEADVVQRVEGFVLLLALEEGDHPFLQARGAVFVHPEVHGYVFNLDDGIHVVHAPPLQIQDKFVLILAENPQTEQQRHHRGHQAVQVGDRIGGDAANHDAAHEEENLVHGIHVVDGLELRGDDALGIEHRGQEVEHRQHHAPEELRIAEEDVHRGQKQTHTQAEHQQEPNDHRQQQQALVEGNAGDDHYKQQRDEGNAQINGRGEHFAQRINYLGHVNLGDQGAVAYNGT